MNIVKITLTFDADECLVNKNDIRRRKGQLYLLWMEFDDKKKSLSISKRIEMKTIWN